MLSEETLHTFSRTEFKNTLISEIGTLDRMAMWHTGSPFEAEELLQDTCVLALRFADSYKEGSNLRAWLLRIMRNRHVSVLRRKNLEKRVFEAESHYALTEWSIGQMSLSNTMRESGSNIIDGLSDCVLAAMQELHPEFRDAVWMCDVEGLSYADAAKRAGRPIGTIMSRIHRGRRALRRRLGSRQQLEAA
jgi:RNA polymerase sigma-70 factor (ECF subfamily)